MVGTIKSQHGRLHTYELSKIAASLGLALAVGLFSPGSEAKAKTFSDVSADYWAKAEIEYLTNRGIINGYQDGRFGITDSITRAEAAAIIIRSLGWGVSAQEDPGYPDVDPSHWAYHEIAMMKHAGFFAPEGKFEPTKLVTRAEMAEMLVNTFDLRSNSGAKHTILRANIRLTMRLTSSRQTRSQRGMSMDRFVRRHR